MKDKTSELTEKLKVAEQEVDSKIIDLRAINSKLRIAIDYEEALLDRLATARKNSEELRNQLFLQNGDVLYSIEKIKNITDVWTSHWQDRDHRI